VQRLGYNPYIVVPSDLRSRVAHTRDPHAEQPGRTGAHIRRCAQFFFRAVTAIHDLSLR